MPDAPVARPDALGAPRPEPVPAGARLLHIGLMKTGTTLVQRTAGTRRRALLAQGVRYPGTRYNHRQGALALMNRPAPRPVGEPGPEAAEGGDHRVGPGGVDAGGVDAGGVGPGGVDAGGVGPGGVDAGGLGPGGVEVGGVEVGGAAGSGAGRAVDDWDLLLAEVRRERRRRVWLSSELVCGSDDATARAFVTDLGPKTHVVVTVRNLASVLPSVWQQEVKAGSTLDLGDWLDMLLGDRPDPTRLPVLTQRHDQGAVVARWAGLVGPERLTVVVVDPADPGRVADAFEGLLDLAPGTLEPGPTDGYRRNRSLTEAEVRLFLEVNRRLPADAGVSRDDLVRVLRNGAARRLLTEYQPGVDDRALRLPASSAHRVAALGEAHAAAIAATGVRVVGDLAELGRPPRPPASVGRAASAASVRDDPSDASVPEDPSVRTAATAPEPTTSEKPMVPVAVAAEALLGALSAGLHRGSHFREEVPPPERPAPPVRSSSTPAPPAPYTRLRRRLRRLVRGRRRPRPDIPENG